MSFLDILEKNPDEYKPPAPLPSGRYIARIDSWQEGTTQSGTPFVAISGEILEPEPGFPTPSDLDEDALPRRFTVRYYLSEKAAWRLSRALRAAGLEDGTFRERLDQLPGRNVSVLVTLGTTLSGEPRNEYDIVEPAKPPF